MLQYLESLGYTPSPDFIYLINQHYFPCYWPDGTSYHLDAAVRWNIVEYLFQSRSIPSETNYNWTDRSYCFLLHLLFQFKTSVELKEKYFRLVKDKSNLDSEECSNVLKRITNALLTCGYSVEELKLLESICPKLFQNMTRSELTKIMASNRKEIQNEQTGLKRK